VAREGEILAGEVFEEGHLGFKVIGRSVCKGFSLKNGKYLSSCILVTWCILEERVNYEFLLNLVGTHIYFDHIVQSFDYSYLMKILFVIKL